MKTLSVTDIALEHRLAYNVAYTRVLRGDFGEARKVGNRLVVIQKESK